MTSDGNRDAHKRTGVWLSGTLMFKYLGYSLSLDPGHLKPCKIFQAFQNPYTSQNTEAMAEAINRIYDDAVASGLLPGISVFSGDKDGKCHTP